MNLKKMDLTNLKLTDKEKNLLAILFILLVGFLAYNFILLPQDAKLASLRERRLEEEDKINEMNLSLMKEKDYLKEWQDLREEKDLITSKYFPSLDQSQIVYLLSDLLENEEVEINDISFSRPDLEEVEDKFISSMDITIPYLGSYDGILNVLKAIEKSPRKFLVENLSMAKTSGDLNGNMNLRVYSLDGLAETDKDIIYIDKSNIGRKSSPFSEYEDFISVDDLDQEGDGEGFSPDPSFDGGQGDLVEDPYKTEVLLGFERNNNYFIPSQSLVKGRAIQSTNSKSGRYSLRLEYNILAVEEENIAYVDIADNKIKLKYPPESIGIWVYSYDYSPATLGLGFRGQMGEFEKLPLSQGINWRGWKYLEVSPPSDLSIYPLDLDRIYVDMPKNREDFGVILVDGLEAKYSKENAGQDGDFIFHVVEPGDNIEKISEKYYGSKLRKNEIMKLNEIKAGDILPVGKVLVLKKP